MNYLQRKPDKKLTALFSALLSALILSACGGGSGSSSEEVSGIGGTGIGVGGTGIVSGAITAFGSVYVNDTRYETPPGTTFIVDGEELDQDALSVGMVVRIEAETEDGEFTGEAIKVVYDDEVEGPIETGSLVDAGPTQKTFEVFGQKITIDDTGTRFENISFTGIDDTIVVEISGFQTLPGEIFATYVKKTSDKSIGSAVELRGTITPGSYNAGPPEEFLINGVEIEVDPAAQVEVEGGMLKDGLFVEVEGEIKTLSPLRILAREIESEDENLGEDVEDVRLEGIISDYNAGPPRTFVIDGQAVDLTNAEITPVGAVLGNGLEVEVEGDIVGGVLIADEVEVEEEESELRSTIINVLGSSFEVQFPVTAMIDTVLVHVDAQTEFEDETGAIVTPPFSIGDLFDGDFVIVKGEEINDEIVATLVKRITPDPDEKLELEGIVDAYTAGAGGSIRVLGIEYGLNAFTQYSPDPNILPGDFVEIEDKVDPPNYSIDGIADEVEKE